MQFSCFVHIDGGGRVRSETESFIKVF